MKLLVINPGSTSTKIGVFEHETELFETTLRHTTEEIEKFEKISDQKDFRKEIILNFLKEKEFDTKELSAVVGRGGLIKPVESGTFIINKKLLDDLENAVSGEHASNLGGLLANEIAVELNIPSFIVDPVVTDEFDDVARFSGIPEIVRKSAFHALNQKAIARKYCKENSKNYEEVNLLVVHLGGGISVGVHKNGRVVDVTNAIQGEGPFTPERSGELPVLDVIELCFSKNYTKQELIKRVKGNGGFNAYLNSNDMKTIVEKAKAGEKNYAEVYDAFIYQLCKEIGKMSTVVKGNVEAILITGGMAYNPTIMADIEERVSFIAKIFVYPGEEELLALVQGALRVLNGEEKTKEY